eukprot:scaffold4850_cov213-Pinguiococcus_pyrenoidosus.AAC.3
MHVYVSDNDRDAGWTLPDGMDAERLLRAFAVRSLRAEKERLAAEVAKCEAEEREMRSLVYHEAMQLQVATEGIEKTLGEWHGTHRNSGVRALPPTSAARISRFVLLRLQLISLKHAIKLQELRLRKILIRRRPLHLAPVCFRSAAVATEGFGGPRAAALLVPGFTGIGRFLTQVVHIPRPLLAALAEHADLDRARQAVVAGHVVKLRARPAPAAPAALCRRQRQKGMLVVTSPVLIRSDEERRVRGGSQHGGDLLVISLQPIVLVLEVERAGFLLRLRCWRRSLQTFKLRALQSRPNDVLAFPGQAVDGLEGLLQRSQQPRLAIRRLGLASQRYSQGGRLPELRRARQDVYVIQGFVAAGGRPSSLGRRRRSGRGVPRLRRDVPPHRVEAEAGFAPRVPSRPRDRLVSDLVHQAGGLGRLLQRQEVQHPVPGPEVRALHLLLLLSRAAEQAGHLENTLHIHLDLLQGDAQTIEELEKQQQLPLRGAIVARMRIQLREHPFLGHEQPRRHDALPGEEAAVVEARRRGLLPSAVHDAVAQDEDPAMVARRDVLQRAAVRLDDLPLVPGEREVAPLRRLRAVVHRVVLQLRAGAGGQARQRPAVRGVQPVPEVLQAHRRVCGLRAIARGLERSGAQLLPLLVVQSQVLGVSVVLIRYLQPRAAVDAGEVAPPQALGAAPAAPAARRFSLHQRRLGTGGSRRYGATRALAWARPAPASHPVAGHAERPALCAAPRAALPTAPRCAHSGRPRPPTPRAWAHTRARSWRACVRLLPPGRSSSRTSLGGRRLRCTRALARPSEPASALRRLSGEAGGKSASGGTHHTTRAKASSVDHAALRGLSPKVGGAQLDVAIVAFNPLATFSRACRAELPPIGFAAAGFKTEAARRAIHGGRGSGRHQILLQIRGGVAPGNSRARANGCAAFRRIRQRGFCFRPVNLFGQPC